MKYTTIYSASLILWCSVVISIGGIQVYANDIGIEKLQTKAITSCTHGDKVKSTDCIGAYIQKQIQQNIVTKKTACGLKDGIHNNFLTIKASKFDFSYQFVKQGNNLFYPLYDYKGEYGKGWTPDLPGKPLFTIDLYSRNCATNKSKLIKSVVGSSFSFKSAGSLGAIFDYQYYEGGGRSYLSFATQQILYPNNRDAYANYLIEIYNNKGFVMASDGDEKQALLESTRDLSIIGFGKNNTILFEWPIPVKKNNDQRSFTTPPILVSGVIKIEKNQIRFDLSHPPHISQRKK